ncbi:MAG: transglycosylase domain-containing protein [Planctomycetota bacterium]
MTKPSGRRLVRWGKRLLLAVAGLCIGGFAAERGLDVFWPYPLDRLQALERSTVLTARDGTWLRVVPTSAGERVLPLGFAECPKVLLDAVLVGEDERFFAHGGVDWVAGLRAAAGNLTAGRVVSGASTLTMQVVRIVEPRPRTWWSKCIEVVRARQLERLVDKERIAALWLEQVPLGGTLRGFEAAARFWFGCSARELDAAQAVALVAMVPAPSARSPLHNPTLLRSRRDALLQRMGERGLLAPEVVAHAVTQELGMRKHAWPWLAPHAADAAWRAMRQGGEGWHGGDGDREVDGDRGTDGVHASDDRTLPACVVTTAVDLELHGRVQAVVQRQPELPGDGLAVVVVRRADGSLPVVLGDRDPLAPLDLSARPRSAGSTCKPFLYALAHERGAIGAQTLVDDLPRIYDDWRPANFDRGFLGRTRAGDALATSSNLAAVRCLEAVGTGPFAELLQRLGLRAGLRPLQLDAALGTDAVSPRQLARAYWRFVERPQTLGLSPASVAFTLQALRRLPLVAGRSRAGDVAWKSGTSSGRRDAWCVGVTERHVVVVWLGNRDGRGLADLVGVRTANRLLAEVLSVLPTDE